MLIMRLAVAFGLMVAATVGHTQERGTSEARANAGAAFEKGRTNGTSLVPVEPLSCIAAWLVAGNVTIRSPEGMQEIALALTEQNATANWWHWWSVHYDNDGGDLPEMDATVQQLNQALGSGNPAFFEVLGACWVNYDERKFSAALGGGTMLKNFLVERLGLPQSFAITLEDRAKRTQLISVELEVPTLGGPDRISRMRGDAELLSKCKAISGVPSSIRATRAEENQFLPGDYRYFYEVSCEVF